MDETKRSANFTSMEESILLSLVRKYQCILENKKTDSNMNRKKAQCWKEIEKEFNNECGQTFRESGTLKKKYENLKKRTKKKLADEKCYAMGAGGGPSKKATEITDVDMEIRDILSERIDGFSSEFGGDAEIITIVNDADHNINELLDEHMEMNDPTKDEMNDMKEKKDEVDWSSNNVQNLKTPKSSVLTIGEGSKKRKRDEYDAMCSKVNQWAASKADLEQDKQQFAQEEHEKKLELMKQKFDVECEVLRRESEVKIKKMEEESAVTLAGIAEQNKLKREILLLEKHILLQKLKIVDD